MQSPGMHPMVRALADAAVGYSAMGPTSAEVTGILEAYANRVVVVYADADFPARRTDICMGRWCVSVHRNLSFASDEPTDQPHYTGVYVIDVVTDELVGFIAVGRSPGTTSAVPTYQFTDPADGTDFGIGWGVRIDLLIAHLLIGEDVPMMPGHHVPENVLVRIRELMATRTEE